MEMNLYEAIEGRKKYLPEKKAKFWIYQALKALDFMHKIGIFHRDIKPENILLLKNKVKLADLGSCKGMYSKPPFTEYISTRWYRSPECLLTDGYYNYKMDIWGLGCVFYEILTLEPLFPGDDEIDQVNKINNILGSPSDELFEKFVKNSAHRNEFNFEYQKGIGIQRYLTHVSADIVDLIEKMLIYDPDLRPTARQCLFHECFKEFVQQDLKRAKMSQMNFYQNSILMKSFNDSISIKNDDSIQNSQLSSISNSIQHYSYVGNSFRTKLLSNEMTLSKNNYNSNLRNYFYEKDDENNNNSYVHSNQNYKSIKPTGSIFFNNKLTKKSNFIPKIKVTNEVMIDKFNSNIIKNRNWGSDNENIKSDNNPYIRPHKSNHIRELGYRIVSTKLPRHRRFVESPDPFEKRRAEFVSLSHDKIKSKIN